MARKFLIAATLLAASLSSVVYAESSLKELDNFNPDLCRQELLKMPQGKELDVPVVIAYYPECHSWQKLEPIIEKIAKKYPNRRFYKYNIHYKNGKDAPKSSYTTCLQQVVDPGSPTFSVFDIEEGEQEGKEMIMNFGPISSKQGAFADVDTPEGLAINEKKIEEFIFVPASLTKKKSLFKN